MKKQLLIILLSFSTLLSAQNFWQATTLKTIAITTSNSTGAIFAIIPLCKFISSTDNGTTWSQPVTVSSIRANSIIYISGGYLYVATEGGGVYRSTDNGTTWNAVNSGLTDLTVRSILSFNGSIFASTANAGIFKSTDGGLNWTATNTGLTELNVPSIVVHPNGTLFASVKGANGIYKSTDNGGTWQITSMTKQYRVYSMSVRNDGLILAGTGEYANGIYRSTDNGATWIQSGLIGIQYGSNSPCVFASDGTIFTGSRTNTGVFKSTNSGLSWDSLNSGLISRNIYSLEVTSTGYIYAGTDSGLYRSVNKITAIEKDELNSAGNFSLMQNFPNPFNPSTVISYSIPSSSFVKLAVYNALGQTVKILENTFRQAGSYSISFNAADLPSGIYFYKLEGGQFTQIKKMMLLK